MGVNQAIISPYRYSGVGEQGVQFGTTSGATGEGFGTINSEALANSASPYTCARNGKTMIWAQKLDANLPAAPDGVFKTFYFHQINSAANSEYKDFT